MKVITNMQLLAGSHKKKSSGGEGAFSLKFNNQKVNIHIHFTVPLYIKDGLYIHTHKYIYIYIYIYNYGEKMSQVDPFRPACPYTVKNRSG